MAISTTQKRKVPAIGDIYETDPAKIADISTIGGGIAGLAGAAGGNIANSNLATGRALRKGIGDFLSIGSNAGKPFMAHWDPSVANAATPAAAIGDGANGKVIPANPAIDAGISAVKTGAPAASIGDGANQTSQSVARTASPPLSSPTTAPKAPSIGDPGTGYAMVDGKRINYSDIGGIGDPLAKGEKSGGFIMSKQAPGIGATPADPNVGAADREFDRQSRQAQDVQDQLNLSGIGVMSPKAAKRYILARQGQQELDQRGQKLAIDSQALDNDLAYKQGVLAIDAPLKDAMAKNNLAEAKAREFAVSPEGVKRELGKKDAEDRKDAVTKYFDLFKGRSLPQQWAGKHMDLAKKFAMSDDPANDYGIFFNPSTPNRSGIGVSKKLFLPIVQDFQKKGFPEGAAMARAMGYLQSLEKTHGKLYEDIPNMDRFVKTDN